MFFKERRKKFEKKKNLKENHAAQQHACVHYCPEKEEKGLYSKREKKYIALLSAKL